MLGTSSVLHSCRHVHLHSFTCAFARLVTACHSRTLCATTWVTWLCRPYLMQLLLVCLKIRFSSTSFWVVSPILLCRTQLRTILCHVMRHFCGPGAQSLHCYRPAPRLILLVIDFFRAQRYRVRCTAPSVTRPIIIWWYVISFLKLILSVQLSSRLMCPTIIL